MRKPCLRHRTAAVAIIAALTLGAPGQALAQSTKRTGARVAPLPAGSERPTRTVTLSIGEGERVVLPANITDVWTSNSDVADVYVNNPRQIHLFGKAFGEATIYATSASGAVVYSANVQVAQNLSSIDAMMKAALPDADVNVTVVGQLAVLNGVVLSPETSAQAERLALSLLNPGVNVSDASAQLKIGVINRLRMATPQQVNLQVRIAEVSRSFIKNVGVNLTTRDNSGGFLFGLFQGRQGSITTVPGTISPTAPVDANGAFPGDRLFGFPAKAANGTTLGLAGRLLGLDIVSAIDLGERTGQVTTLANPNLTALSGETGSFLAGGEIPIPISQGLGAVSVEYKQYGVSLAYTPTVLSDGRISLRVRPEVSQLSDAGSVQISGVTIPALTTRRAETTVELGSGQSLMIGGLLSNTHQNSVDKAPGLGDLPIVGALFRSNSFQRSETELVIVITPYLVKPVDDQSRIALPTDGYKAPSDLERVLLGQSQGAGPTQARPVPTVAAPYGAQPAIGAVAQPLPAGPALPMPDPSAGKAAVAPVTAGRAKGAATPGFGAN